MPGEDSKARHYIDVCAVKEVVSYMFVVASHTMTNGAREGTYGSRAYIIMMYSHVGGCVSVETDSNQHAPVRSIGGVA